MVEIDSWTFHSTRRSFEFDRHKEAELVAAGLRVAHVTWRQLNHDAFGVVARLATALAA